MNASQNTTGDPPPDGGAAHYKDRLLEWLRAAVEEGWLAGDEIQLLQSLEARGAERLFAGEGRPLTVGFFGGTGVGKSSLLNRLVGEPVAEVGLERPTSTEVTVYVHEQFPIRNLAGSFPVERVKVLVHRRDPYRDVVWIDMPDIDSIEERNRELVFEWLPCIDWLIYVVSPEKYRDDAGWRVLMRRRHRHHWLFVINRWDTGTEPQYADFKRLLADAGWADPVVLRTSCTAPVRDDFESMADTINRAVAEHGLERLQQVGERARLADLKQQCDRYSEKLGGSSRWRAFIEHGQSVMDGKLAGLNRYLRDEAAIQAAAVPDRQANEPSAVYEPSVPGLVDDHIQDLESGVAIHADDLPAPLIRARTRAMLESLGGRLAAVFRDGFRQGMARPGNAVQRTLAAWMRKLVYGLPLMACAGMAYVVVTRYREGLRGAGEFLGFEFLAHSLMVLGLAALLPYLLGRLLRPSVRRSIVKRVEAGLRALRSEVLREWGGAMDGLAARSRELRDALDAIRSGIDERMRPPDKTNETK